MAVYGKGKFGAFSFGFSAAADIVTFRAVENFDRVLPLAARFLAPKVAWLSCLGSTQLPSLQTVAFNWTLVHVP
jgi:hypothetical protein